MKQEYVVAIAWNCSGQNHAKIGGCGGQKDVPEKSVSEKGNFLASGAFTITFHSC